jgi:hypothetical protein
VVELRSGDSRAFEAHFDPAVLQRIGIVTDGPRLNISLRAQALISLSVNDLVNAWSHAA